MQIKLKSLLIRYQIYSNLVKSQIRCNYYNFFLGGGKLFTGHVKNRVYFEKNKSFKPLNGICPSLCYESHYFLDKCYIQSFAFQYNQKYCILRLELLHFQRKPKCFHLYKISAGTFGPSMYIAHFKHAMYQACQHETL